MPSEDAGDRVQKKRKHAMVRIPLDKIGFWSVNRGGLGISPYHAHEVAWDCMTNKTLLMRYGQVDLMEIPDHLLDKFRQYNQQVCESDPLMPSFSP